MLPEQAIECMLHVLCSPYTRQSVGNEGEIISPTNLNAGVYAKKVAVRVKRIPPQVSKASKNSGTANAA